VLFSFFWTNKFGVETTLKRLFIGYVVLDLAIAISALIAPELVVTGDRLRGDLIANTGSISAISIIFILGYPALVKNRITYLVILTLSIILLLLSQTRSAYVSVLLLIILAMIRYPKSNPLRGLIYLTFAIVTPIAIMFQWTPSVLSFLIRDSGSIATLSDRIPLWRFTLEEMFEQSPWVGLGFYANRAVTTEYNPRLGTSHSAFVEILSGGGFLSFAVFSLIFLPLLFLSVRLFLVHGKKPMVFSIVCILFSTVTTGLVSEEMIIASPTSFTFWILLSIIPMITDTLGEQKAGMIAGLENDETSFHKHS
jgi:hypothetical protein